MKLKKFFAGVLAAAMMLTVGATAAFAKGPATDETGDGTISFKNGAMNATDELVFTKTYDVRSGIAPAETFNFEVKYDHSENKDTNVGEPSFTGANPTVEFKKDTDTEGNELTGLATGKHTGSFKFKISDLGISTKGTGVYYYTVKENAGSTPGVRYDSSELTLKVTVAHKTVDGTKTGEIVPDAYDYYVALYRGNQKISNENAFTNYYGKDSDDNDTAYKLDLKKTVKGNFGDLGKTFTFNVVLKPAAGKHAKDYAGAVVSAPSDTTQNGKVWAIDGTTVHTVTIGHGDTVTLTNLPEGVIYAVTEDQPTETPWVYTVTGQTTDTEGDKLVTTTNANNVVSIVNTHEGTPDMGVVLDNAPYIAMLAIVAIGGVALMLNKRRRDEE